VKIALLLNRKWSWLSVWSHKDKIANVAAEKEIFIQNVAQLK
jgi:hypothetical protein